MELSSIWSRRHNYYLVKLKHSDFVDDFLTVFLYLDLDLNVKELIHSNRYFLNASDVIKEINNQVVEYHIALTTSG